MANKLAVINKLSYTLVVTGAPYGTQQASSAYQFAQALLERGHCLASIFFYREGVYNANQLTQPANDEFDLVRGWQRLTVRQGTQLNVCVVAAMRRGVVTGASGVQSNLQPGFILSGLGALAEALLTSDRTVQF